jgi:hypothetical protein
MSWLKKERPALTLAQLAVEEILTRVMELPVGRSILFPDRAQDGFGGMVVKRYSWHTLVFQRAGSQERSRWADGLEQARREIETYLQTGKLREPDKVQGW